MANITLSELSNEIREAIEDLRQHSGLQEVGIVTRVGDGIAWVYGLEDCGSNEMLEIEALDGGAVQAFALNLNEDEVGAVLLGDTTRIKAGAKAHSTGKVLEVPVGPELVGRIVDPLGRPLDDMGPIKTKQTGLVEQTAPSVIDRQSVNEPLMTGILAIDSTVPIGRGQRELIIGDRQTGKTAILIDTMINQAQQKTGVINIYVAIGQKLSKVARLVERLKREGVMEQTIVVATSAADPAPLQYLAPYAATAMGEYFRDNGQHALIMHDDLSKHAVAYRQMSLLLRRPPGREAYPGDVFYLHSRLLERAAKLSDEKGGGSLTALPVIETQAGDISAYIPTNVISITDGQIFLETNLFYQGIRPAISVGLSVSRVGGAAQYKAIKDVSKGIRLGLAQFRELAAFTQFSTDLDDETKAQIQRGQALTEILKQPQYKPYHVWQQVVLLMSGSEGLFDHIPLESVAKAKQELLDSLWSMHKKDMQTLNTGGKISETTKKLIIKTATNIARDFVSKEKESKK